MADRNSHYCNPCRGVASRYVSKSRAGPCCSPSEPRTYPHRPRTGWDQFPSAPGKIKHLTAQPSSKCNEVIADSQIITAYLKVMAGHDAAKNNVITVN